MKLIANSPKLIAATSYEPQAMSYELLQPEVAYA
jgi:hypothetical protein